MAIGVQMGPKRIVLILNENHPFARGSVVIDLLAEQRLAVCLFRLQYVSQDLKMFTPLPLHLVDCLDG